MARPSRVYVSGHDAAEAEALAGKLSAAGFIVTSTWHDGVSAKPDKRDAEGWLIRARENTQRIVRSDALVLIGGSEAFPGDKYIEAGYAAGLGYPVYNFGAVGNGLANAFTQVADFDGLVSAIRSDLA